VQDTPANARPAASSTWLAEDAAGGLGSRIEDSCFSSISGASFN